MKVVQPGNAAGIPLRSGGAAPKLAHGPSTLKFVAGAAAFLALVMAAILGLESQYVFFAGYVVLQFVVLATGWNILGGYAGYVNFGAAGYFALGAYTTVALYQAVPLPLPILILAGAVMGGLLGLATGAMSLRLKGVYFSIATMAIVIILETVVMNSEYLGSSRGISLAAPPPPSLFANYHQWLFFVMAVMVVLSIAIVRYIENSWIGRGLRAIRDDETAAECCGVPTLKLKLFAATMSGAVMSAAGAPFALYLAFIEPTSAFSLNYALSAIAMPIIGGMSHWIGPVIGAVLLGSAQQYVAVSLSGHWNVLIIGVVLMFFVIVAPDGILGLVKKWHRRWKNRSNQ
jgi:branched-chain amino acid transport system permease protein